MHQQADLGIESEKTVIIPEELSIDRCGKLS